MKKIYASILLFTLFSYQQSFSMDKEQAFEECTETCSNDLKNVMDSYAHECKKEGFSNRVRCFTNGVKACSKYDSCVNKCFKAFDETVNQENQKNN